MLLMLLAIGAVGIGFVSLRVLDEQAKKAESPKQLSWKIVINPQTAYRVYRREGDANRRLAGENRIPAEAYIPQSQSVGVR